MSIHADNPLNSLLRTLQNPIVRDLAWSCFSPPLILSQQVALPGQSLANCALSLDSARRSWLEQLDAQPSSLLQHLDSSHSRRLGLYYEALWHFFLQQDERVELVAHNLAVRQDKQTVGEFDCLYYCHERQRHIHLELAVKFYLGLPGAETDHGQSEWAHWLGPGGSDRLDIKLEHLRQRQLQLGQLEAAREPLRQLGIETLDLEMEIKGRLFQPVTTALGSPLGYNRTLAMSQWMTCTQALATFGHAQVVLLDKNQWLAPLCSLIDKSSQTMEDICKHHQHNLHRPRVVAILDSSGCEEQRIFVTPEHWPEQTS